MGVADIATGESLQLKKNVILAYTDIAAAGRWDYSTNFYFNFY